MGITSKNREKAAADSVNRILDNSGKCVDDAGVLSSLVDDVIGETQEKSQPKSIRLRQKDLQTLKKLRRKIESKGGEITEAALLSKLVQKQLGQIASEL